MVFGTRLHGLCPHFSCSCPYMLDPSPLPHGSTQVDNLEGQLDITRDELGQKDAHLELLR